ncbi:MAG: peroxiredoxin [Gammaproteobacteria bacterium]|uniref:thioredoxin-dependent peroxiredoxin n=1 Tax=SAR86 cluster bacterium TaxID=2030880 RepID=A0A520N1D8_9GAMM|nr:peroxiredoxin [Gammaproteobacteria bacterium]MBA4729535.1 peroxiredoxin [SAR86 cluster bacterium]RPG34866.1 MAG: peroxiredoxin [Gammaproteobacteria bacterium TMED193]RZO27292.1 MAG: peroxiredoxin [SAR86 cluster bacterium]|tara:strand:- start:103 stop:564 length:462 start_codon:yes stop_codon:yes gene_type:complete
MSPREKAPSFSGLIDDNKEISIKDFSGKFVVIFFYPKDKTSGCTVESQDFRDLKKAFEKLNCAIVGVSRDSLKSHKSFIEKESLNFPLISDGEEAMCNAFDVMKEKSMYGRKYMGIERSTFLIDGSGHIVKEWRKVKVPNHAKEVYDFLKSIS